MLRLGRVMMVSMSRLRSRGMCRKDAERVFAGQREGEGWLLDRKEHFDLEINTENLGWRELVKVLCLATPHLASKEEKVLLKTKTGTKLCLSWTRIARGDSGPKTTSKKKYFSRTELHTSQLPLPLSYWSRPQVKLLPIFNHILPQSLKVQLCQGKFLLQSWFLMQCFVQPEMTVRHQG